MKEYQNGSYKQPACWFRIAAENDSTAQYILGHFYSEGIGVAKDQGKAFSWYLKAADHSEPNAMRAVILAYKYGIGVHADAVEALHRAREYRSLFGSSGSDDAEAWIRQQDAEQQDRDRFYREKQDQFFRDLDAEKARNSQP